MELYITVLTYPRKIPAPVCGHTEESHKALLRKFILIYITSSHSGSHYDQLAHGSYGLQLPIGIDNSHLHICKRPAYRDVISARNLLKRTGYRSLCRSVGIDNIEVGVYLHKPLIQDTRERFRTEIYAL